MGASPFNWLVLLPPFYANSGLPAGLLLLQLDALVFVSRNLGANLGGRFAQLGLLVGEEAFLGAGVALG